MRDLVIFDGGTLFIVAMANGGELSPEVSKVTHAEVYPLDGSRERIIISGIDQNGNRVRKEYEKDYVIVKISKTSSTTPSRQGYPGTISELLKHYRPYYVH